MKNNKSENLEKQEKLRDAKSLVSAALHGGGAVFSIAGLVYLILALLSKRSDTLKLVSVLIFGISQICMYASSTIYHILFISEKVHRALRRLDHIMIFFLIAGTYTPICLVTLRGQTGWVLFGIVWGLSIAGVFLKIFWINAPRWVSAACYVLLGWAAIFVTFPLSRILPLGAMWLLLGGGTLYTIGAVVYAIKVPWLSFEYFGNHELFHIFVMLGSSCHYLLIALYV